jgi:cobalamin biosynthesis protein CobW
MSRVPATVVTGFLGAGKTSLVRHVLEQARGRRIAVIVNEFGEVGIDRELLVGCAIEGCGEDDIVELANGCICCTVADDFLPTMERLLERAPPPDHIVIETSGLALPKPLVQAFAWPAVRTRATVDGVITVIDAAAVRDGLFAADPAAVQAQRLADPALDHESPLEELFEEQLGSADLVILNKADLLAETDWPAVEARVAAELRPGVPVIRARDAKVPLDVLLGRAAAAEADLASRRSHHDDGEPHEHDDFTSFAVPLPTQPDAQTVVARLERLATAHGILRVKGFAVVAGKPMRLAVQGVGRRIQAWFDRPWRADETRQGELVVIGLAGLDRAAITAALQR